MPPIFDVFSILGKYSNCKNSPEASTVYCAVNIACVLHCCLLSDLWKTEQMQVWSVSCYFCKPCPLRFVEESPAVPINRRKGLDVLGNHVVKIFYNENTCMQSNYCKNKL